MTQLEKDAADLFNDMIEAMDESFQESTLRKLVEDWLKRYNAANDHRNNAIKMLKSIFPDDDPFRVDL